MAAPLTARRRPMLAANDGWSLIDVLLATVFLATLTAILQSTAVASLQALRVRSVADDLDETARIALEIMARDIRDAGYGLESGAGLRDATPTRIRLVRDLDLDGATSSTSEIVTYELAADARQLRRQPGNAAPQPMVESIVASGSGFVYRDATGNEIAAGGEDGLLEEQRRSVRQIELTLRLEAAHPVPGSAPIAVEHRVHAGLRNAAR